MYFMYVGSGMSSRSTKLFICNTYHNQINGVTRVNGKGQTASFDNKSSLRLYVMLNQLKFDIASPSLL